MHHPFPPNPRCRHLFYTQCVRAGPSARAAPRRRLTRPHPHVSSAMRSPGISVCRATTSPAAVPGQQLADDHKMTSPPTLSAFAAAITTAGRCRSYLSCSRHVRRPLCCAMRYQARATLSLLPVNGKPLPSPVSISPRLPSPGLTTICSPPQAGPGAVLTFRAGRRANDATPTSPECHHITIVPLPSCPSGEPRREASSVPFRCMGEFLISPWSRKTTWRTSPLWPPLATGGQIPLFVVIAF
jgi:hypothetical protein